MSWTTVKLTDLATVSSGGGAPQDADAFSTEGTPFVRAGSLIKLLEGLPEDRLELLQPEVAAAHSLRSPYDTALSALIHEGTFRTLVGNALVTKARIIKDLGNKAVHETRPVPPQNAITCVRELFHFSYWLVRTYARGPKPDPALAFNPDALPRAVQVEASTLAKLQALAKEREDAATALAEEKAARIRSEEDRAALDAEVKRLQAEIAAQVAANAAVPDTHDYNEAETRDAFIDLLLAEAGWPLDQERDREYPVKGMPGTSGDGFADYVLWGDDGKPLAVIEAKRTKRDARVGQQQAKLYADCLEGEFGVRPLIFHRPVRPTCLAPASGQLRALQGKGNRRCGTARRTGQCADGGRRDGTDPGAPDRRVLAGYRCLGTGANAPSPARADQAD